MDPKEINKLFQLLKDQGDKLLTSEFKFNLTGSLLRALNDSFSLIIDENESVPLHTFQVTKPNNSKSNVFRELQFIHDFIQKTLVLKLTKFLDDDDDDDESCIIDITKFRNLKTLEIQRVPIKQIIGLQQLRSQLQEIIVEKSITNIKELIISCAGDNSNGFIWNSLKRADFSFNNLDRIDNSLEFTPYLQHLNLSHNKIYQISALVWLPNLKVLNLSYNQLTIIPKFNQESYRRLQVLIIKDNFLEDISGLCRFDGLQELDVSGNCMIDHSILLPLCTLHALRYLNLAGNPLSFHPKHRATTARYLSKNASTVKFVLDTEPLSKNEKLLTGGNEHYHPSLMGNRASSSIRTSNSVTPITRSVSNTPENSSLSSISSFNNPHANGSIREQLISSVFKHRKVRVIEEFDDDKKVNGKKEERPLTLEGNKEHLTTKQEIEEKRQKYGDEWLFRGFEDDTTTIAKRKVYYEELFHPSPLVCDLDSSNEVNVPLSASTPQDDSTLMPIHDSSLYVSAQEDESEVTIYKSMENIYPDITQDEEEISDIDENEATTFVVMDEKTKVDLILVLTDEAIKEKDALTCRTLTKWGITTLESCERVRTNLIQLNFDTIKRDKKDRQYRMESKCCQNLERLLRDILSSRPLSENLKFYKCAKCNMQFSREIDTHSKSKKSDYDVKCPSCNNIFVIEIQQSSKCAKSPPKSSLFTGINIAVKKEEAGGGAAGGEGTSGINKTSHSFSSIAHPAPTTNRNRTKTDNKSAFDSNQSVAGSNSVEVLSEEDSSSQTSLSSIEVLESVFGSRKHSEDRRISQVTPLETINDDSSARVHQQESFMETLTASAIAKKATDNKMKAVLEIGNINLTESSSSGSVCDSVCTAYEQNDKGKLSDSTKQLIVEKESSSRLEGLFKSTNMLMSKTPKSKRDPETPVNHPYEPIQYNYEDLSIVDHRIKLHIFQNVLEDNDEKLNWIVRGLLIEDEASTPNFGIVIMSTKKFYVMKIDGIENEDVSSWMKRSFVNSVDKMEYIQMLPYKMGLTFWMRGNVAIHLLLQDENVLQKLTSHIVTSNQQIIIETSLPTSISDKIMKIGNNNEDIKTMAVFKTCQIMVAQSDNASIVNIPKKTMYFGALSVSENSLLLMTNFNWLCDKNSIDIEVINQPMTNLVELENVTKSSFVLSFMDETDNTIEKWKFTFESCQRIFETLTTIGKIWEELFCVPLISTDQHHLLCL